MERQIKAGLVEFRDDHTEPPFRKAHIRPIPDELEDEPPLEDEEVVGEEEFATQVRGSYFYKQSQVAVKYLRKLMGAKAFDNPKDHLELARLFNYVTSERRDSLIVDFFAGSASSAHAVMELNRQDGGKRRFIVAQFPEKLDPEKKEQKSAAKYCESIGKPSTIAEIAKERIRRSGVELQRQTGEGQFQIDAGFRVLKIDTSNMRDVYYAPDAVAQGDLLAQVDNIKPDRTAEDLLFQVLVDWGIDLALPIATETIAGKQVFFVDTNALAACFDAGLTDDMVKEIARRKPLRAVFRDASYGSDAVKINVDQIFKLLSPDTEVRSI
jgi:adenine-specific DNA-methyltransferase